jgi:hypothetical protein
MVSRGNSRNFPFTLVFLFLEAGQEEICELMGYAHRATGLRLRYCHVIKCDSLRGFGLDIGFIDHFNTQLLIALNCGAIAEFHILHGTTAQAKSFEARSIFIGSCLVMASNNDHSSASGLKSTLNGGSLPTANACQSQGQSQSYDRRSVS